MTRPNVVLVSNDIVPGSGVPVAAPGLRVFGLAEGLKAHGFQPEVVVAAGVVKRVWRAPQPLPVGPGTHVVRPDALADYLAARRPVVAVLTNSNQARSLRRQDGVSYVYDFFAPKVLEEVAHPETRPTADELRQLRERKVRALAMADAVIVNGHKKLPYALAWLLQTDRDVTAIPLHVVPMCVPTSESARHDEDQPTRLGVAGYIQPWSAPGAWFDALAAVVERCDVTLDLLLAEHWGDRRRVTSERIERVAKAANTNVRGTMTFGDFCGFLESLDVIVDLFDWNIEREYAMVTRTVVALARGVPVVHPPFTEVAPMIAEYDAGWLVDPSDVAAVEATLEAIVQDPDEQRRRRANAARLAREVLDPRVAVQPLVDIIDGLRPA